MASELFGKANDEFINENYESALKLYDEALELEKNRDDIFCNRAQTNIKLEKYKDAVEDSEAATKLNPNNAKAFLRKGTAFFHLEDYESALQAFQAGKTVAGDDGNFKTWIRKCEAELDLKAKNKLETTNVGVSLSQEQKQSAPAAAGHGDSVQQLPVEKPLKKYDWYQTNTHVMITILYKNCLEDNVKIDIQERSITVDIKLPSGSDFFMELQPLSHTIVPAQSMYKVMKSKVEVKLKKTEGVMWKKLEGDEEQLKQIATADPAAQTYPSSSHYTRNWDKLAKEVEEEEKTESKEGDAALNDLFKKIYSDGTDETKKAMVKSFYESGGTVLSTNWGDIGKKETEVKPPDGMEYKKWEA